jgi:hypothetical protein
MEGEESGENPLSLASLQSWVLVRIGRKTLPTVFPRPSNARRTSARKRCRWQGSTSGALGGYQHAGVDLRLWMEGIGKQLEARENSYQGLQFRVFKVVGIDRACFRATYFCTSR